MVETHAQSSVTEIIGLERNVWLMYLELNVRYKAFCYRHWHISPVLRQLHWLPVRQRVEFNLALLIYKSLLGQLPPYLADDCSSSLTPAGAHFDHRSLRRSSSHVPTVHSAIRVSLLLDLGFGTGFRPLCAQSTCLLMVSNGH